MFIKFKPKRAGTLCVFLSFAAISTTGWTQPPAGSPGISLVTNELIVLLDHGHGTPPPEEVVDRQRQGLSLPAGLGVGGPRNVEFLIASRASGAALESFQADPEDPAAVLQRYLVFRYPIVVDIGTIADALSRNPVVLYVGPNRRIDLSVPSNDPLMPIPPPPVSPDRYQWGIHALRLPEAWDLNKGHAYVAVTDTGIDTTHPDLRTYDGDTYLPGGNFRSHLSHDYGYDDENVDEGQVQGSDVPTNGGHGTHVTGIIAATTNNDGGVAGACWYCSLIISKISRIEFGSNQSISENDWVEGINGSIDKGAQVLSMSLGLRPAAFPNCDGDPDDPLCRAAPDCVANPQEPLCKAIALAKVRDVVVVAAAGNDGNHQPDWPAIDDRVLGAAGIEFSGNFWNDCTGGDEFECGSNWNPTMLDTPARQVLSTFYRGFAYNPEAGCGDSLLPSFPGFGPCTGTSMATPFLAGSVGILRSADPLLSRDDLEDLLLKNLDNPPGWDPQFGHGKPDIAAALRDLLGEVAGQNLLNRLTPLFSLYSFTGKDHYYTTSPQMGTAAIRGFHEYVNVGPDVPGYGEFPHQCTVGPCPDPGASVYIFTTDRSPNGHPLVPLYRLSFEGPTGQNADNRDVTYTTETAGVQVFSNVDYRLDGIEGYIYQRCTPEPGCIPTGAVRLFRLYHPDDDDYAIFPESEEQAFRNDGYISQPGLDDWIGYVYENVDSDSDDVIDGFETLVGTDPSSTDSDCDGASDGAELLGYPGSDPQAPPASSDWIISQDCTLATSYNAPLNVVVQNTATLTISSGVTLDINLTQHHLLVKDGSKVIVKQGARIH